MQMLTKKYCQLFELFSNIQIFKYYHTFIKLTPRNFRYQQLGTEIRHFSVFEKLFKMTEHPSDEQLGLDFFDLDLTSLTNIAQYEVRVSVL